MPGERSTLLPPNVVRGIGDKLYDKRKSAALEVEQLVKSLAAQVLHPWHSLPVTPVAGCSSAVQATCRRLCWA